MQEEILTESDQPEEEKADNEVKSDNEKMFPHKYVEKLRRESSRYRTALKEMREQFGDFSGEDIEEYKRLKETFARQKEEEERMTKETKAKEIEDILSSIAESYSAIAPKQVAALLKNSIDINDEGNAFVAENNEADVREFVKKFLGDNLHFVKSQSKKKGANANSSAANIFSLEQVSKMTAEQYKRNRDRILKSLSQNT